MKKLIAVVVAVTIGMSLAACGSKSASETMAGESKANESEVTTSKEAGEKCGPSVAKKAVNLFLEERLIFLLQMIRLPCRAGSLPATQIDPFWHLPYMKLSLQYDETGKPAAISGRIL